MFGGIYYELFIVCLRLELSLVLGLGVKS